MNGLSLRLCSLVPAARWLFSLAALLGAVVASSAWASAGPLAEIERTLRGKPEVAVLALTQALPGLRGAERVEALVVQGILLVRTHDPAAVDAVVRELEQLAASPQEPAATTADTTATTAAAAAGLLRARSAARGGPAGRADRLLTEAMTRLPANAPASLRLRFVDAHAEIKRNLGKFDLAIGLYQQAVALADALAPLQPWRRSDARSSLAYALAQAHQLDRALEINREGALIAQASGDLLAQSLTMTIDGILFGMAGRTADELRASQAAIEFARQAGAKRREVLAIANLADFYLKREDYATALRLALEALPLAREVKELSTESVALTNAGLASIALGRHDEGKALVRQALMLEERSGALSVMLAIQLEYGEMLERVGLLRDAWTALTEYRRLADEVFQRQQQQAVLELQESFDADRRQRELAALQTDNGLKEAQLLRRELQQRLWAAATACGVLLLAVVGVLLRRMWRSNSQLVDSNAQLQVASERDPLTGLANRRHLLTVMQQRAAAGGGGGFEGSMLLIDLDHFKRINDEHGHAAGDTVLVEMAGRLRATLREEDLTVRWGGEEFLVVVHSMSPAEVEALADRLLDAIGREPVRLGRESVAVTASIGFATFPLQPARRALAWERAIDLVDTAMYLAKAHGRNRAYGVRALQDEAGAGASAQPATLESAWRDGRADLTQLAGPVPVSA